MNAKKKLLAAAVAAAVIAGIIFAMRPGNEVAGPAGAAGPSGAEPSPSPATQGARPAAPGASGNPAAPPAIVRPEPGAPPPDAPRVMPYRPASFLLYSDGKPAKEAGADDDAQPVLARIFEITHADPTQQVKIREFWHTHENGRRVLWAQAYPRVSGPRMLDPEKLEELDVEFESAMFGILQPSQKQALSQELPPAGTMHTPLPRMYANPAEGR